MMPELEELTTNVDRRSGQRRFRVTADFERVEITVQHESNEALGDEAPHWRPVDHPPVNERLAEQLLDLVCALRARRFCLSLSDTPPVHLPSATDE